LSSYFVTLDSHRVIAALRQQVKDLQQQLNEREVSTALKRSATGKGHTLHAETPFSGGLRAFPSFLFVCLCGFFFFFFFFFSWNSYAQKRSRFGVYSI